MKRILLLLSISTLLACSLFAGDMEYRDFVNRAALDFSYELGTNTKVAIMSFDAESESLSDRLVSDLESELKSAGCIVLNRSNIDSIIKELEFQTSGMVDDYSAVSIGHMLGAEKIIVGSATNQVSHMRIELMLIDLETTLVSYQKSYDLKYDTYLRNIMKGTNAIGSQKISLGVRAGAAIGFNKAHVDMIGEGITAKEESAIAFAPAVSLGYRITEAFTAQLEMIFSINGGIKISGMGNTIKVSFSSMEIPAIVKFSVITNPVELAIFAGAYVSFPLSQVTVENPYGAASVNPSGFVFGALGGFEVGVAVGPGRIFADARYMKDFGSLYVKDNFGEGLIKQGVLDRSTVNISLGYAFAL